MEGRNGDGWGLGNGGNKERGGSGEGWMAVRKWARGKFRSEEMGEEKMGCGDE